MKVFVAGHKGLIGSAFTRRLKSMPDVDLALQTRDELDLQDNHAVRKFFEKEKPEHVYMCAGRVGGIQENVRHPAQLMEANLGVQLNVMRAARDFGAKQVFYFGSSCMYPRDVPQPMAESALLSGKPEPTSLPYAMSKLAGVYHCLALNQELESTRFIPVIPNNVYGPEDDFNFETSHVLPALIRRFHEAKQAGAATVDVWGSGEPLREFVFVDDVVDACLFLGKLDLSKAELPLNIGTGSEVRIKDLVLAVASEVGFEGELVFDTSKPDGAPRKGLDSTALRALGWTPKTSLQEGIRRTYHWYLEFGRQG